MPLIQPTRYVETYLSPAIGTLRLAEVTARLLVPMRVDLAATPASTPSGVAVI